MQVASVSEQMIQREQRLIADAMRMRYYPLVVASASGCTVTDVDGRQYLDLTAGWCVANTGYGHPAIQQAIADSYRRLSFWSAVSNPHPSFLDLAERLVQLVPGDAPRKVSFANSGSEANDGVAKLVPLARKRPRMISFIG